MRGNAIPLTAKPAADTAHQRFEQALALHQRGDLSAALSVYQQMLDEHPQSVPALHFSALAYLAQGEWAIAQVRIQQAIQHEPDTAVLHSSQGDILATLGLEEEAIASYRMAIALQPDFPEAHFQVAQLLHTQGDLHGAVGALEQAIRLRPDFPLAFNNLGNLLAALQHPSLALQCYQRALVLQPNLPEALLNRVNVLRQLGHLTEALASYQQLSQLQPDLALAHNNAGLVLHGLMRYREAEQAFARAIQLNPRYAATYAHRGHLFRTLGHQDKAEQDYQQALALQPGEPDWACHLGNLWFDRGQYARALAQFQQITRQHPQHAEAWYNQSLCYLKTAQWSLGWSLYEWRWQRQEVVMRYPAAQQWDGHYLQGTLRVWGDQGVGDVVFFSRYLPYLLALTAGSGVSIELEIDERLCPLFMAHYADHPHLRVMIPAQAADAEFSAHITLSSLPRLFFREQDKPAFASQPCLSVAVEHGQPYRQQAAKWRAQLQQQGHLSPKVIGVAWRSINPYTGPQRSIALEQWQPLFELAGGQWVSLQHGDIAAELQANAGQVATFAGLDCTQDFTSLAAAIQACDLVISIDNSLAHLAAALGQEVWLLLPAASEWRWPAGVARSHWYPRARYFQQTKPHDWAAIIERIHEVLSAFPR